MLHECLETLEGSGFNLDEDDPSAKNSEIAGITMMENYRDSVFVTSFRRQRAKLQCCRKICKFIMSVDLILQSLIQASIRDQITRFENDLRAHFKYIPSDDLLNDNDVRTVLESDRSSNDPKVYLL